MTDTNTNAGVAPEEPQEAAVGANDYGVVPSTTPDPNALRSAPDDGKPKMLFIDIETAPAVVYAFGLFKQFIGIDQIIEPSRIICYSAQWYGQKQAMYQSEFHQSRAEMIAGLHQLLDEADIIVHYNGKRFDTPWIIGELITEGLKPPSPFKQIDLFTAVKGNMRNLSNKLDYVSQKLLGDHKTVHTGFKLWRDCLAGDPKAWALMKRYNIKDTKLMIPLYERLRPYIKQHPNVNPFNGKDGCPACGSLDFQKRGYSYVGVSKYQRYQCTSCGGWFKDGHALERTSFRQAT